MDNLTTKQRKLCMSRIRSENTKPEMLFRKAIWSKGLRGYRVHNKKIEGKPDIYFPSKKLAVFIDGCFWHKCPTCALGSKTNKKYWNPKIEKNILRDKEHQSKLLSEGWKVIVIWECEAKKEGLLLEKLEPLLGLKN